MPYRRRYHKRYGVVSKRRKTQLGKFRAGKRRRRIRVSKRLRRAIKSIAFADTQVRWLDNEIDNTSIRDLQNCNDNSTVTTRLGTTATTGVVIKPFYDVNAGAGIAIGTGDKNRTSQSIYVLGYLLKFKIRMNSNANNDNRQAWVRMVYGYKWVDQDVAAGVYATCDPNDVFPVDANGCITANYGASSKFKEFQCLMPFGTNRLVPDYEKRSKYHIVGQRVMMIAEQTTSTDTNKRFPRRS